MSKNGRTGTHALEAGVPPCSGALTDAWAIPARVRTLPYTTFPGTLASGDIHHASSSVIGLKIPTPSSCSGQDTTEWSRMEDSLGLQGKCRKLEHTGWVGSTGPLAHVDLWSAPWNQWLLMGIVSCTMDPVACRSRGQQQNERADESAIRGLVRAF